MKVPTDGRKHKVWHDRPKFGKAVGQFRRSLFERKHKLFRGMKVLKDGRQPEVRQNRRATSAGLMRKKKRKPFGGTKVPTDGIQPEARHGRGTISMGFVRKKSKPLSGTKVPRDGRKHKVWHDRPKFGKIAGRPRRGLCESKRKFFREMKVTNSGRQPESRQGRGTISAELV